MRFGSLFAGIGGIDLGLERAGMECAWQVDNDEFCQKVLTKHWPDVPKYTDIRNVGKQNLETVDLIAGGFPCQPVSLASGNRRKGTDDDRWLWPEFYRIIRLLRPQYVLVENTPGLLSLGWEDILGELATSGYDAEWQTFPAVAIGAPHKRDRVFIVAYTKRKSWRSIFEGSVSKVSHWGTPNESPGSRIPRIWDKEVEQSIHNSLELSYGFPQAVGTRLYGNAVVPQVAEFIGKIIMKAEAAYEPRR